MVLKCVLCLALAIVAAAHPGLCSGPCPAHSKEALTLVQRHASPLPSLGQAATRDFTVDVTSEAEDSTVDVTNESEGQQKPEMNIAMAENHKVSTSSDSENWQSVDGPPSYGSPYLRVGTSLPSLSNQVVWWLHFPKCGTSFGETVATAVKSPTRDGGATHQILTGADNASQVVAIFREPKQRLASGFKWIKTDRRCCTDDWGWDPEARGQALSELDACDDISTDRCIQNSIHLQSFQGCQVNMMLGHGCLSRYQASASEMAEAHALVDQFLFVGLQSEWRLSICLYNYITAGERFIQKWQLDDTRPSAGGSSTEYDTTGFKDDPADGPIYEHAKTRFYSDLKKHGVTNEACRYIDVGP